MSESDTDRCRNPYCQHRRGFHIAYGDEYDYDYHDCQIEGCQCIQFEGEDDEY